MDGKNVSLHIIDIITLMITRLAHIHPLFTVHFNVVSLEIMFVGATKSAVSAGVRVGVLKRKIVSSLYCSAAVLQ